MFSNDVDFEIPGDKDALPWNARKMKGRGAVADFVRGLRGLTEPIRFNVHDLLTSENRAVIVGELATKIETIGKRFESPRFHLTRCWRTASRFRGRQKGKWRPIHGLTQLPMKKLYYLSQFPLIDSREPNCNPRDLLTCSRYINSGFNFNLPRGDR